MIICLGIFFARSFWLQSARSYYLLLLRLLSITGLAFTPLQMHTTLGRGKNALQSCLQSMSPILYARQLFMEGRGRQMMDGLHSERGCGKGTARTSTRCYRRWTGCGCKGCVWWYPWITWTLRCVAVRHRVGRILRRHGDDCQFG